MLDIGTSINAIPYNIYASLNPTPLKENGVIIQLIDRINVYPKGITKHNLNDTIFQPYMFFQLHPYSTEHILSNHIPSSPVAILFVVHVSIWLDGL